MKKGFTLAEVLVTIAIIGIVAVIAVPLMTGAYEKRVQYSAFMKMYTTLKEVMTMSEIEHKTPDKWGYNSVNMAEISKANIYPYLNIKKICEEEVCVDYRASDIRGENTGSLRDSVRGNGFTVFLDDGSILYPDYVIFNKKIIGITFTFDTNGEKGPNVIGRDIFILYYSPLNNKWRFSLGDADVARNDCDPKIPGATGLSCPAVLIKDGKMAY